MIVTKQITDPYAAFNIPMPTTTVEDSVWKHLQRAGGHLESKVITLNANNTSQSLNCFQLTGSVEIMKLYAEVTTATTFTNCTDVHFDLYDGTIDADITKSTPGAVLSGMPVGTFMAKTEIKTSILTVSSAATASVAEATGNRGFSDAFITQKNGVNTYLRFHYATTDAPIAATISVYCIWEPLDGGTLVAV